MTRSGGWAGDERRAPVMVSAGSSSEGDAAAAPKSHSHCASSAWCAAALHLWPLQTQATS